MTDPGRLNRRLALEAPVETPDGAGGVTRTYETAATLWASVEAVAARGAVEAGALGANVTHRIRIRFSPDITVRHRFRDGARVYRIASLRVRDRRFVDIDAEERTD
ncbi:MAG: head-tail adaptor protein [Alphaproteobacteria bacterium]|nr:head-tail adaptor protein [Alphaproteobacteria bacterium]